MFALLALLPFISFAALTSALPQVSSASAFPSLGPIPIVLGNDSLGLTFLHSPSSTATQCPQPSTVTVTSTVTNTITTHEPGPTLFPLGSSTSPSATAHDPPIGTGKVSLVTSGSAGPCKGLGPGAFESAGNFTLTALNVTLPNTNDTGVPLALSQAGLTAFGLGPTLGETLHTLSVRKFVHISNRFQLLTAEHASLNSPPMPLWRRISR